MIENTQVTTNFPLTFTIKNAIAVLSAGQFRGFRGPLNPKLFSESKIFLLAYLTQNSTGIPNLVLFFKSEVGNMVKNRFEWRV